MSNTNHIPARRALTAVLVALAVVVTGAAPASASPWSWPVFNQSFSVATQSQPTQAHLAWQVTSATGDNFTAVNQARAIDISCGCYSAAISFQVLVVSDAPANAPLSLTNSATVIDPGPEGFAYAEAEQWVMADPGHIALSSLGQAFWLTSTLIWAPSLASSRP